MSMAQSQSSRTSSSRRQTRQSSGQLQAATRERAASRRWILSCDGFQPVDACWNVSESARSRQRSVSTRRLVAEVSEIGKWREVSPDLAAQDRTALFVREGAPDILLVFLHVRGGLAATVGTGATSGPHALIARRDPETLVPLS